MCVEMTGLVAVGQQEGKASRGFWAAVCCWLGWQQEVAGFGGGGGHQEDLLGVLLWQVFLTSHLLLSHSQVLPSFHMKFQNKYGGETMPKFLLQLLAYNSKWFGSGVHGWVELLFFSCYVEIPQKGNRLTGKAVLLLSVLISDHSIHCGGIWKRGPEQRNSGGDNALGWAYSAW